MREYCVRSVVPDGASLQDCRDWRVPWHLRDYCAHLTIALNKCRHLNWMTPMDCNAVKHKLERCEYDEYLWEKQQRFENNRAIREGTYVPGKKDKASERWPNPRLAIPLFTQDGKGMHIDGTPYVPKPKA